MSIIGNILIDKLRISIPIPVLEELGINTEERRQELMNIISGYFYDNKAFSATTSYGYLRITLTPTRFKPDDSDIYTDTNLEMPSEDWLLNLFVELGFNNKNRRLCESANITWIHLTKNIITNSKPLEYIMFLHDYPLKKKFISSLISSNAINSTLRLSTPKRDTKKKDVRGDRTYIFYDKTQELHDKAKMGNITPKFKLTDKETKYISQHGGWYMKDANYLNISGLNLLRCELQYKYQEKIQSLQKFLNPKSKQDSLTVATIIDLLQKKVLYSKLNEYYVKELQDIVFYKLPNEQQVELTSYKRAFADLIDDYDSTTLELLYKSLGLDNIYKDNKATLKRSNKPLYSELYQKIILGQNT